MKVITPSAMAALTPAETEVGEDGRIEEDAGEFEALAVLLADPGIDRSVVGVEALVVRVERFTGAVAASTGIVLVPGAFEVRTDVAETVCVANGTLSGPLDLDPARRVPEEVRAELDGFVTEITEVFNTMIVAGSSTDEASSTAATEGIEGAATSGMEMAGIVGAATIGATDAATFVLAGTGVRSVVGPT